MNAILTQLQHLAKTSPNENPDAETKSGFGGKNKEDKDHKDEEDEFDFHMNEKFDKIKDKVL